ncbi:MAG: serine hydrolase [Bacteroidota bacterium]
MKKLIFLFSFAISFNLAFSSDNPVIKSVDHLTDSIQVIMEEDQMVGAILGVIQGDSVLFSGGFGYADKKNNRLADENTLFRLGSVSKLVVALGILKLVEDGQLDINENLKDVAPDVPFKNNWESTDPVKVVHLLEHTSGFDDVKVNRFCSLEPLSLSGKEKMLAQKSSLVCRWKPGERYAYSNPNYAVLGYIIEKRSGLPFEQYLKQKIFDPLGMAMTNFESGNQKPDINTKEYKLENGIVVEAPSVSLWSGADGGMWSSAKDMLKLLRLFLDDGAPLFQAETIKRMETSSSSLAARSGLKAGYGLGNGVNYFSTKLPYFGHDGYVGTCHSGFFYNRELDIGFVMSSNREYNGRPARLIANYLLDSFPQNYPEHIPLDLEAIQPYLGQYQFDSPRNQISAFRERLMDAPALSVKDGKLIYDPLIGPASELHQTGPLTFAWKDNNIPRVILMTDEDGKKALSIMGRYYSKRSKAGVIGYRILIAISAVLILASIPVTILMLILKIFGKVKDDKITATIIPAIALIGLIISVMKLWVVQMDNVKLAELASINATSILIFLGTSIFGIGVLCTGIVALNSMLKSRFTLFNIYYMATFLAFAIVFSILWQHGWIGMRTWSL